MAFDQSTRNRLQKFVSSARSILSEEFTRQLQATYGIDPKQGAVAEVSTLTHLDNRQRQTAHLLRDTLAHYMASTHGKGEKDRTKQALDRIVREQAFTVLNRLCALRMAEARGFLLESIAKGYTSKGFQLYKQLAGSSQGATGDAYRNYLFSLFDEFSLDLAVLFDRYSIQGLLFPRESALLELLQQIDHHEIEPLWAEDETIGWIYQYYNDPDERKKMRKESAAPRNSRELAVRNQFFTPRYVVEFLTDNTLGRIWYEMMRGQTRLADQCRYLVRRPTEIFLAEGEAVPETPDQEGLSQEELLKQPVYIPHRPLKDPREIRLLDPACGSMHFGLYAFDLFETIYQEAWDNGTCRALREAYPSKEEFLRDVPRLIIEHNIHGIEIDPRAVQIAGLSLWLRAQKSWQAQGLKPADRPRVRRSNVVCAEPMPGSPEMLEDFVATLDSPVLGELVKTVFDKMQLAGEAGSLLKIEEEIQTAIEEAREQSRSQRGDLFDQTMATDETFFDTVEHKVIDALRAYAEQADADSYQRRLFADDAARGFAFIDLCRKRYDVTLMNPPFGLGLKQNFEDLKQSFPDAYVDIFAAFITRLSQMCCGRLGAITSRSLLITKKLERLRSNLLLPHITELLDLGWPVMDDATVQSCAYVLDETPALSSTTFIAIDRKRTLDKETGLESRCKFATTSNECFVVLRSLMRKVPQSKVLYNLPPKVIQLFASGRKLGPEALLAKQGMKSFDDFRFLRLRDEVSPNNIGKKKRWEPLCKGGSLAFFFSDLPLLINWNETGDEIAEVNRQRNGQTAQARQASIYYRRPGGTYSRRCKDFGVRVLPSGFIIGEKGPAILPNHPTMPAHFLIGLLNSRLINALVNIQANAKQYDTGIIERLPSVDFHADAIAQVERAATIAVDELRRMSQYAESECLFLIPCIGESLRLATAAIKHKMQTCDSCVASTITKINSIVDVVFEVSSEGLPEVIGDTAADENEDEADDEWTDEDSAQEDALVTHTENTESTIFYLLGTAYGRWDIRYATGERQPPELPDPFDPLPVCPPGMIQNAEGLPAEPKDVPTNYPLRISWPGTLVDDEKHPADIIARVRTAIEVIWKDRAEAIEQEACEILGMKTLRDYFRRPTAFFADHLKRYSKSRRQAPIYWPLSTQSGSYTLWLYYHRLNNQTLYTCINDFVEPKLKNVTDDLSTLRSKTARSSQEEKELANLTDLEAELKDYREELLRIANFWKPNLNDGVQITAAPLWTLFQLKPWQKKLKETWESLEKGQYDWAHLACSVWPERVLRKCHHDRSLAIAHEVEDIFWHEVEVTGKRGKKATGEPKLEWQPKELTDDELETLIQAKIKDMT